MLSVVGVYGFHGVLCRLQFFQFGFQFLYCLRVVCADTAHARTAYLVKQLMYPKARIIMSIGSSINVETKSIGSGGYFRKIFNPNAQITRSVGIIIFKLSTVKKFSIVSCIYSPPLVYYANNNTKREEKLLLD